MGKNNHSQITEEEKELQEQMSDLGEIDLEKDIQKEIKLDLGEQEKEVQVTEEALEDIVEYGDSNFGEIEREHIYENEKGQPTLKVTKNQTNSADNKFSILHNESGEWFYGMNNQEPIPYKLPELIEAVKENKCICITYGEKDTDTIMELSDGTFTATTTLGRNPKKWKYDFKKYLQKNSKVVILCDDTVEGKQFTENTKKNLKYILMDGAKVCHISKLKALLHIVDTNVTDFTELRNRVQNDDLMKRILHNIVKQSSQKKVA